MGWASCRPRWRTPNRRPDPSLEAPIEARKRRPYRILLRGEEVDLGRRTLVMGILNATPDSFSDGGHLPTAEAAVAHGLGLFESGADWVDVGGESTRPGAARVETDEERRRVVPVVEGLRRRGAGPISVDTTRADVAEAALDAGADLVNDVSGFRFDPRMAPLVAERSVPAVLMHSRGGFEEMHREPAYDDVATELTRELGEAVALAERSGVSRESLIIDPGLGFAKDASQSLTALAQLSALHALDRPVLVGPSRKSFIGKVLDRPVGDRRMGTAAAVSAAIFLGAHIVRVHDVHEMVDVAKMSDAIIDAGAQG